MKKMKKFTFLLLLLLFTFGCASIANAALNSTLVIPAAGGRTTSVTQKKTTTGNPSVDVKALHYLDSGLAMTFRIRTSEGTAASAHYTFYDAGVKKVYYLNSDFYNDTESSYKICVQTQSTQSRSVVTSITWTP